MSEHRVLVCGGRTYKNMRRVFEVLDGLDPQPWVIIQGGAPGADHLAWEWAGARRVSCEVFIADWRAHGRAAGPIRNQQMLDEGKPDLVIAFPGGTGTRDMTSRAKAAGIPVVEVGDG